MVLFEYPDHWKIASQCDRVIGWPCVCACDFWWGLCIYSPTLDAKTQIGVRRRRRTFRDASDAFRKTTKETALFYFSRWKPRLGHRRHQRKATVMPDTRNRNGQNEFNIERVSRRLNPERIHGMKFYVAIKLLWYDHSESFFSVVFIIFLLSISCFSSIYTVIYSISHDLFSTNTLFIY